MDKMQANGIQVILDIPGLPAPVWLHRAHPAIDIVNQNGARLPVALVVPEAAAMVTE